MNYVCDCCPRQADLKCPQCLSLEYKQYCWKDVHRFMPCTALPITISREVCFGEESTPCLTDCQFAAGFDVTITNETELIQFMERTMKNEVSEQSAKLLAQVVLLIESSSLVDKDVELLKNELHRKKQILEDSEKSMLALLQKRYAELRCMSDESYKSNLLPLLKKKHNISFSVTDAIAVYKDTQNAFTMEIIEFWSQMARLKSRLASSSCEIEKLLERPLDGLAENVERLDESELRAAIREFGIFLTSAEIDSDSSEQCS